MAQVKVVSDGAARTPTQEVVADANLEVELTVADGRVITIGRITNSIRRRVYKLLSPESAAKDRYVGMIFLAASVKKIDGEVVRFPTSEAQFDSLVDRLGDALDDVGMGQRDHFLLPQEELGEE